MSTLTQPTSPQSRRSSSVSTLGQYNNSTLVNLYTRQTAKRKVARWRLVRNPVPLNPAYRKNLIMGIFLPCVAAVLFVGSTLGPQWETIHIRFDRILQLFSIRSNCSTFDEDNHSISLNNNYSLEYIVFRNGDILNPNKLSVIRTDCLLLNRSLQDVIGVVLHGDSKIASMTETTPQYQEKIKPRPISLNKFPFRNRNVALLATSEYQPETMIEDEIPRNLWLIMDFNAGIWSMNYLIADVYKDKLTTYNKKLHPDSSLPLTYVSYLQGNLSETKITCSQFLLKMQNNIISCVLVVYLSITVSVLIGAFSTVFRAVPASMVTGVLYVTSGVFIVFANCIHHAKLNRLQYEWGPCHPISVIPEEFYTPDVMTIYSLWPVLISWASSFVFFTASIAWIMLTQIMTFENSKTII